jgi:hypothetical protein
MRSTARVAVEALDVTPSWTLDCAPGALFLCMRHAKGDSPRQATPGMVAARGQDQRCAREASAEHSKRRNSDRTTRRSLC